MALRLVNTLLLQAALHVDYLLHQALLVCSQATNSSRQDLVQNLLRDYDRLIPRDNLTVRVGLTLSNIWLDRSSNILTSFGWIVHVSGGKQCATSLAIGKGCTF